MGRSDRSRGRRWLGLALLAGAIALIVLLWPDASEQTAAPAEPEQPAGPVAQRGGGGAPGAPTGVPRLPKVEPKPPIIDEIIVEKSEVCRGEENLITVRAHTPDGVDDPFLHYMVVSAGGSSVPVRLDSWQDDEGDVAREVVVFGRDNVATSAPLPHYTIKECEVPRKLVLTWRLLPNAEHEFEMMARVIEVASPDPLAPVRYRWTFGDGSDPVVTDRPYVRHDFGDRPQDTLYSSMLVTCEAIASDGDSVVGRASMQLLNVAFEELMYKGSVKMFTTMTPRFPQLAANGRVEQTVRLWHSRPDPVTVDRVVMVRVPKGATDERQLETQMAPPEQVMGTNSVPRSGIRFRVSLDPREQLARLDFYLEGHSIDGLPAHGNFSVMMPPDRPTRENSRPVMSGYLKAKILRARELLGKEYVTDEEIWQLEREGRMADIRPEDYPPPEPDPEPPRTDVAR